MAADNMTGMHVKDEKERKMTESVKQAMEQTDTASSFEENIIFLNRYYDAPQVEHDNIGMRIVKAVVPAKFTKWYQMKQAVKDLKEEGAAADNIFDDDVFDVDTEEFRSTERRKLTKRSKVSLFLLLVLIPITILACVFWVDSQGSFAEWLDGIFGGRKYYIISLIIVVYSIIPFFMVFEGRKPQARELIVLATLAAIATAGRGAFFMLPHFKPMVAVTIISGIAFGGEAGFLVGAVTMLVSNMLFGQGMWTPWQMLALGLIGFLSGILNRLGLLPAKRLTLCIYGFLVTIFIYGGIMNPASCVMSVYEVTWQTILAAYISGIPVDLVHATSTFIFLWIGAKPLLEKLQRIKVKYGLIS